MMNILRSRPLSANSLRQLSQLFNRHSSFHARRPISSVPPSSLNKHSFLSPQHHPLLPSAVNVVRHLRTGRDRSGGFEEKNENTDPKDEEIQMIVPEGEAYVIERSGEYVKTLTSGTHLFNPNVDRIAYIHSLEEGPLSVPPHTLITEDDYTVSMDGVLSIKIVDPKLASYAVEKPNDALIELVRTTVQSEVGKIKWKNLYGDRSTLNDRIAIAINKTTRDWGLQCTGYKSNYKDIQEISKEEWLANIFASKGEKILINESTKIGQILLTDWKRILDICVDEKLGHHDWGEGAIAKLERILKIERERLENILAKEVGWCELKEGKAEVIAQMITAKGISLILEELKKLREHGSVMDDPFSLPSKWGIQIERESPWPLNWGIQVKRSWTEADVVEVVPDMKAYIVAEQCTNYYVKTLTAGTHRMNPPEDHITYEYSLKETEIPIPHQNLVTEDGVSISFNGYLLVKVVDPKLASYTIDNPVDALVEIAKSNIRSIIESLTVQSELDNYYSMDEILREKLQFLDVEDKLREVANAWGLEVLSYEIKDVSWRKKGEIKPKENKNGGRNNGCDGCSLGLTWRISSKK